MFCDSAHEIVKKIDKHILVTVLPLWNVLTNIIYQRCEIALNFFLLIPHHFSINNHFTAKIYFTEKIIKRNL